ncbi:hypothetical protein [Serinicoccus kebangsaanensis]|uniref:hypothetical protein n=1 Tax=Serinicoccus kebangsaanensis TaxID=2602069 RepID=UPI00124E9508|nr:hypothetical protein [Serinicoccus kebangsaanensis]
MSGHREHLPLVGFVLSLLTLVAVVSASSSPDHLLLTLALAGMTLLGARHLAQPLRAEVVSVQHRSEVCRAHGVRSTDPDRPGPTRPRAPGLG